MRINKYVAAATGLSRRTADQLIANGHVSVNGTSVQAGQSVSDTDTIFLDGKPLAILATKTIILHKPAGYVVSRDGQGSKTVYDLLPPELHHLKPVGRLDKDSSGLLLLTSDGQLAQQLTHPKYQKTKIYETTLDRPLRPADEQQISRQGVTLEDGPSKLTLSKLRADGKTWRISMHEGRNRQIRRTFAALGYAVQQLHRTHFGPYALLGLASGTFRKV
jgi:23S rRNA pseudouridine2605 synthase